MIATLRHLVPFATQLNTYRCLFEPNISCGLIALGQAANIHLNKLLILQKRDLRLITMYFADGKAHSASLFVHSRILPVTMLNYHLVSPVMHDINNQRVPSNISMLFTHYEQVHHHHLTRFSAAGNLYVKASRTNQLLFSFAGIGVRVWNSVPKKIRIKNRTPFKRELKNRLLKLMEIEEMNVDFSRPLVKGLVHTMPDKFENATLLLRFGLPSTLQRTYPHKKIRENGTFWIRSPEWNNLKTQLFCISVDGELFVSGTFWIRLRHFVMWFIVLSVLLAIISSLSLIWS